MDLERALDTAKRAAEAAGEAALRWWRHDPRVELKPDRTPVTEADTAAEAAILAVISEAFPDHDVLAEESGSHGRGSAYRWIVDPLDGTRGFARGASFWGPLIALEHDGDVLAGALGLPALGELYVAARGLGCSLNGARLSVSETSDWADATLSLGELSRLLAPPLRSAVCELAQTAASARAYGDLAAVTLLLQGRAEAWIEAGVKVWDIAPMRVLVEEAGGRFADLAGGCDLTRGEVLATNGRVHDHVAALLC